LKLASTSGSTDAIQASPGLPAGRGLKLRDLVSARRRANASPGLTAGRGLKPKYIRSPMMNDMHRPASRPGAD